MQGLKQTYKNKIIQTFNNNNRLDSNKKNLIITACSSAHW